MDSLTKHDITRRGLLAGTGALIVSFSAARAFGQQPPDALPPAQVKLPGSLDANRMLDGWIRIDADDTITVFTGKAELGQGVRTALRQVAAEELFVKPEEIVLVTADTGLTPDEGYTSGSQSMQNSGTAIRNAAAQVRAILVAEASRRFDLPPEQLKLEKKTIAGPGGKSVRFGELVAGQRLHVEAQPQSRLVAPEQFRVIGKPFSRVDIPGKVTGGMSYMQDLRLEGMVHARVIRPPSYGARLKTFDPKAARAMPGVIAVIRDGNFLAVVAKREYQAIKAMRVVEQAALWEERETLPGQADLYKTLIGMEREVGLVEQQGHVNPAIKPAFEATFTRPYQIHGSIGPSCAVAYLKPDGKLDIWSHTQGVFPDRKAIAQLVGMAEENVRIIHLEGSGCYGHNGADDAAADAALIALNVPGRPVRVQWTREQEHQWEPYGPAMVTKLSASLTPDGKIDNWRYDLWSNTHTTRPGGADALLAGQHSSKALTLEQPKMEISANGNGDRNAIPLYVFPNRRVLWHFLPDMPVRVSALRGLGAYANVFSIESAMDELAILAKADPVEFRLRHLEDQRAIDVVKTTAEKFGWYGYQPKEGVGRGFAFARYKNHAAYMAIALEARLERETGHMKVLRAVAAIDSGEAINHDGIINQTEGGIIQSISWTLYEAVTFDRTRVTSMDWSSYPILRFASVPDSIEVHVIDRPGEPFLGTGEAAQGPTSAALGNAIRNATGTRLFDLPLTRERIKAAIGF